MSAAAVTAEPKAKKKVEVSPEPEPPIASRFALAGVMGAPAGLPLFMGVNLQRKLAVGAVDDPLEREADQVAEQVLRSIDRDAGPVAPPLITSHRQSAPIRRKCACDGSSEKCEECRKREEEASGAPAIHRKADSNSNRDSSGNGNGHGAAPGEAPPIVHEALRSPGQPLDGPIRAQMESSFGRDFSDVRVHTDSFAAKSAAAVNSRAYTAGRDVFFASGEFIPQTESGRRLLAHELTHTAQTASASLHGNGAGQSTVHRQPAGGGDLGNAGLAPGDALPGFVGIDTPALLAPYTKLKLRAPQTFESFERTAWQHQSNAGLLVIADLSQPEVTEAEVPVRSLAEPQAPEGLSGTLRERMWPIVSDAPTAEDLAAEVSKEIALRWGAENQELLDSMVRIHLVETPNAPSAASSRSLLPLKFRPVLEFEIEGEPIESADGSLPLLDLDPLGSNDLENIVAMVQQEATTIAQAGDLFRASKQVVATEIEWWEGARNNWDRASRDEVRAHAQIFSFDMTTSPVRPPLGLSVALFLDAFPEYSDVLGEMGAQVLELQQRVNKDVGDFEQYFQDPGRRGELYTFKQGKEEAWRRAQEMSEESPWEGMAEYFVAEASSVLYHVGNTFSGGYLETHAQGVEAWEQGHISMDQLNALTEAAMWRGLAVGVVTTAVTIATAGLAGPAAGTAVSLGQKVLTAGFVGFTSTLSSELTGTAISASYDFQDPTSQAIWKEGVHSPGQILATSVVGGAFGAASVPAGVLFGKMFAVVRGAFRTAQAAAPVASRAISAPAATAVADVAEIAADTEFVGPSATTGGEPSGALVSAPTTAAVPIPNLHVPGWEVEPIGEGSYRLTRQDIPGEVIVSGNSVRYQIPTGSGMRVVGEMSLAEGEATAPAKIAAGTQPRPALPSGAAEASERVWVNRKSGVYHLSGSHRFGKGANGEYMSLAQAEAAGFRQSGVRRLAGRPSPTIQTGQGVVAEPRTAGTGGVRSITEERDVFGLKSTTIRSELKKGMKRGWAPNFNREWKRAELIDDVAAALRRRGMKPSAARAAAKKFARNYEAAHLVGPGTGDEAAAGMLFAPKEVNQVLQNRFAEKFARILRKEAAAVGGTVEMKATSIPFDSDTLIRQGLPGREIFLEHVQYEITVALPNQPPRSIVITVSADLPSEMARGSIQFYPPELANLFMDLGIF